MKGDFTIVDALPRSDRRKNGKWGAVLEALDAGNVIRIPLSDLGKSPVANIHGMARNYGIRITTRVAGDYIYVQKKGQS